MTQAVSDERGDLISRAEAQFSLRVISFSNLRRGFLGEWATAHAIKDSEYTNIDDKQFFSTRDWFEQHGWLLSRQRLKSPPFNATEHHYPAPIEYLSVDIVYHATRVANLTSIADEGLQPATVETCNVDRLDSLGYIYAATQLGNERKKSV